ncbi:MAG: multicopper oxidase domain-containing protein [Deltaproteobacteria bacterium]|nr:multicopper oxidase domain-containing protein [Deltaproteobacteria bacterium]
MGTKTDALFDLWPGAAFYVAIQSRDGSGLSPYSNVLEVDIGNLSPLLDSKVIPKYQDFLIIPPVMPSAVRKADLPPEQQVNTPWDSKYEIALKQFDQQILPSPFPKTTVWSYGNLLGPAPGQPGSTFNYPAFTVEVRRDEIARVTWTNGLVDESGQYLPPLLAVDRTLHWANPELLKCMDGGFHADCRPDPSAPYNTDNLEQPYRGPVPMVTHVHGAHVNAVSDGYPEAWWLPAATNIPEGYALKGSKYGSVESVAPGKAVFEYDNSQSAATLWYHDHSLGMTRTNVYAGPAGFWLVRDAIEDGLNLPGPAPKPGEPLWVPADPMNDAPPYWEIPIVIQDRSFNADGSLHYPDSRLEFDGFPGPYIPEPGADLSPIWNPEVFLNTMVVNGRTWPVQAVEPDMYRFRFLNGCDARFLMLKLVTATDINDPNTWVDLPSQFTQIGAEQGLLPNPVSLNRLLIAPAERADVIVNFSNVAPGTQVYLVNVGPDEPFGGGEPNVDFVSANPETTGQVMMFNVVADNVSRGENFSIPVSVTTETIPEPTVTRRLSLNEKESAEYAGPEAAFLGTYDEGNPTPMMWVEMITETPILGDTELWEIYNFTADAHPIHLHLVHFQVVNRQLLTNRNEEGIAEPPAFPDDSSQPRDPEPWETGLKDTVVAYPGEVTRIKATFDKHGLYVWHCHILEHEDNEMMRAVYVMSPGEVPPLP